MKKLFSLCCIFMLFAVVLTACDGGGSSSSSTADQNVTLKYSIWDKNQVPALQTIVNNFEKTHPKIKVSIQVTPFAQYWTKLETAATGESLADVFWMNGPNFQKYASNNIIAPIDNQINTDKVNLNNYPPALVNLYTYQDKHYALPKDFDTIGLWYNKTLFDAAGVKYPDNTWTWQTLQDAAKKLTNPTKGVWGIAAPVSDQEGFYNTIPQNGGFVISPDKKTSGFDDPATMGGLKFWTDFIQSKSSPTQAQMTDTTPLTMFESGKIAMMYGGSWDAIEFHSNSYTKDKVAVSVLPQGKKRATVIHGLGNVISANTQYPQQAWEFVNYLGSKDAADVQAKTGTVIPAYNGTQTQWVNAYPEFHLQSFIDELPYAVPYPISKNTSAWVDTQNKVLTQVWAGQLSLDTGAKKLASQMNQELAKE
ncbi:ABC transporter substrate-binding protein [Dictyobacter formicarum]|uniref:Sugar ABC transporter substrate-binding protein n=1 Tax=Dictyobacter formicarum TaxID=2778368 RepID=A0ABQ3VFZ0_9CHLR|nr:sugar ABC transporter substrate-binding protein [Dictyobacter formicarum]GHO85079.1 sugar ABC transporter substrate-binding protein [Dictyobacter formicarum]